MSHLTKYWVVFKSGLRLSLEFKTDLLLGIFLSCLPLLVQLFVFSQIYAVRTTLASVTLAALVQFTFISMLIRSLTTTYFEEFRTQQIISGAIDHHLTHPFSFFAHILISDLSRLLLKAVLSLPFIFIIYSLWLWLYQLTGPSISLGQVAQFVALVSFGYLVESLFSIIIICCSFWVDNAVGLQHFKWLIIVTLGGGWLPKEFLPEGLKSLMQLLPFKYMYLVPIEVIQGKYTCLWSDYALIFLSGSGLLYFTIWFWRKSLEKYSSSG